MVISQYKVKLLSPITLVMHLPTSFSLKILDANVFCSCETRINEGSINCTID